MNDKIICKGLAYKSQIGFHKFEKGIEQDLIVDFEAEVQPIDQKNSDRVEAIRLDYFIANQKITEFFKQKQFNLIETVAEEIAQLLLAEFFIEAVTVTLTKTPLDIPNVKSVSYQCYRVKNGGK